MSMQTLPVICCGPATEPLDPESSETLAARFRALADPTRVAIVNRLASTEECCVVESSRRGTWAYYRLVPDAVRELRDTLGR
jgi:ArsR family transcriptional regulator, arsenate/arsenite/antimonite-responsive transcriptional repressor